MRLHKLALWVPLALTLSAFAQTPDRLTPHKVKVESVDYMGKLERLADYYFHYLAHEFTHALGMLFHNRFIYTDKP